MSRSLVTLVLAAVMSIGLEGGQSGSWQWTSAHGPPLSPAVHVLTVGDAVLLAWFSGTWRSLDDGETWQPASEPLQSRPGMAAADGQLYVETLNGVIRSSDVGDSFEPCGPLPADRTTSRAIENIVADRATVYVSIRGEGTFRSRDSCASWSAMPLPSIPWVATDGLFAGRSPLKTVTEPHHCTFGCSLFVRHKGRAAERVRWPIMVGPPAGTWARSRAPNVSAFALP